MTIKLSILPEDILSLVLRYLGPHDLAALSQTNRTLHNLVESTGWSDYARLHPVHTAHSLTSVLSSWPARTLVRYTAESDRAWRTRTLTAQPLLEQAWNGKYQSTLASSPARLVVGAGETILSYVFTQCDEAVSPDGPVTPGVYLEAAYTTRVGVAPTAPANDVTCLSFVPDGGAFRTLCVGFQSGQVERIELPLPLDEDEDGFRALKKFIPLGPAQRSPYPSSLGNFVRSISTVDDLALSLCTSGTATLFRLSNPGDDIEPRASDVVELGRLSWCTHLSSSRTYAAFGATASVPLAIHSVTPTGLSPRPDALLGEVKPTNRPAVYSLCEPPEDAPFSRPGSIVISGWFAGHVRLYDLRSRSRTAPTADGLPAPLLPVVSLYDPWQYESAYAVGAGGGNGAHVCAGTARHALVSIWDVRRVVSAPPRPPPPASLKADNRPAHAEAAATRLTATYRMRQSGWSVFGPGTGGSSPVYALSVERTRIFGATQAHPFVLDFGRVAPGTYDFDVQKASSAKRTGGEWRKRGARETSWGKRWVVEEVEDGGVMKYSHATGLDK